MGTLREEQMEPPRDDVPAAAASEIAAIGG
jgi:hypothetical protein